MNVNTLHSLRRSLAIVGTAALSAACADNTPVVPDRELAISPQLSATSTVEENGALATLRRVTARYHDLGVATNDGFVLLHDCEVRSEEGPVGTVYYNPARLLDGVINPEEPDALIYEPGHDGRRPRLVGVEFAIPFALWTQSEPPTFHGATFQREDEFGVFGLHVWVWRNNPNGMFAESNPKVNCGAE